MPMEIDRAQLKRRAKESMSLSKPSFWIVTLVYLLMTTGVAFLVDLTDGGLYLFLYIAYNLYAVVVGFSYRLWALWTCRRLEPGLGSLMEGFSVAGRVIVMELAILVRTMGWTFLFSFAAAFVMMAVPSPVVIGICVAVAVAAVEVITLRYALAPYVLADYPDLGPSVAVAHSVRLTRGWVLELVKLHLSFLGWYILSTLLSLAGLALGLMLVGELPALIAMPYDQFIAQLQVLAYSPVPYLLMNVVALPVTLYFTPYLEVTLAEFYNARIALSDNMADPLGGMRMPPV